MKPVYLLDTNIISEFSKLLPNKALLSRMKECEELCAISSTVWQETIYGYNRLPDGKRKQKLLSYLMKIKELYEIIPYDDFAAQICGELQALCQEEGHPCTNFDSQIAATAIANGMILITHNTSDFATLSSVSSLKVEDWWGDS